MSPPVFVRLSLKNAEFAAEKVITVSPAQAMDPLCMRRKGEAFRKEVAQALVANTEFSYTRIEPGDADPDQLSFDFYDKATKHIHVS